MARHAVGSVFGVGSRVRVGGIAVLVGVVVAALTWGLLSLSGGGQGTDSGVGRPVASWSPRPTPSPGVVDRGVPVNVLAATKDDEGRASQVAGQLRDAGFVNVDDLGYRGPVRGADGTVTYFSGPFRATAQAVSDVLGMKLMTGSSGEGFIRVVVGDPDAPASRQPTPVETASQSPAH